MKQWGRRIFGLSLLLMVSTSGCGMKETEVSVAAPDYDRSFVKQEAFASEPGKAASELTGISQEYCIPNKENKRNSSDEPVVLLYRIDEPDVLAEADATVQLFPASVTKLLTAYTAWRHADLSETVKFSYQASHVNISGAMLCGFQEGDSLSLRDLLSAMLLFSGNDAAIAVAEHVSGSTAAFAELMNAELRTLGGMHSNFVNPHGLHDKNHYTTAYDMYLVLNEMLKNEEFLSILKQNSVTVYYTDASGVQKSKTFQNTNLFLTKEKEIPENIVILGGKTGTTNSAGCCLVQAFSTKAGKTYIAEVFGAKDYDRLYQKMYELMLMAAENE